MLTPSDFEAIREIIREEVRCELKRQRNRTRQKRWYDRHREKEEKENLTQSNANQNQPNAIPSENLTLEIFDEHKPNAILEEKPNALGKNGDSPKRDPLMVSPTPLSLIPSEKDQKLKRIKKPIVMSNAALKALSSDPLYAGIDLVDQAFKFERWCKANNKLNTVRRFVNWINNIK